MEYRVCFSFFIVSGTEEAVVLKDRLLDRLGKIKCVDEYDAYDDGENWCVDCIATIESDSFETVGTEMEKVFGTDYIWDYHYIKNVENGVYWEP